MSTVMFKLFRFSRDEVCQNKICVLPPSNFPYFIIARFLFLFPLIVIILLWKQHQRMHQTFYLYYSKVIFFFQESLSASIMIFSLVPVVSQADIRRFFAKKILDENSYFLLSVYCTPLTSIKTSQRKMLTPSPPYLLFSLFGEKNVRQKVQLSRIVVILGICLSQKM